MIYEDNDEKCWIQCDICRKTEQGPFDTKQEAIDYKKDKSNGWTSNRLRDGSWIERCPNC